MAEYTRSVSASDREGLRNLLAMHEQLVGPILTGRGGRIVKNIGDSFMALFDSATDAIRACMDLVEAHNQHAGSGVSFRAGICTGDVEETDTDAFGEPVNLAARIIARTPTGEVWFSNATRHCMTQAEIPYETTGRHALKGIPGDIEIFRAVPTHAAYLPDALVAAVRTRVLVRWAAGDPAPTVPNGGLVLLEGFRPGSRELTEALDRLPWIEPGRIHLCTYHITPEDRYEWTRAGRGLVIATQPALVAAIRQHEHVPTRAGGSDTIILDGGGDSVVDLVVAGLALPMVPLSEVVAGYSYDQLPDGRWVNRSDRAVVRVEVTGSHAELTVLAPGVQIDGQAAPTNMVVTLSHGSVVRTPACALYYHALDREGYLGAFVGDTQMRIGVPVGQQVELGREPQHPGLLLPARGNQDNLRWLNGPRAMRAREKGFTLDTSLTGRRQAAVVAENGRPVVVPLHETCPTVLLDTSGRVQRLAARSAVAIGDLLLLGTTCVAIRDPNG
jgi:hypothetical protein